MSRTPWLGCVAVALLLAPPARAHDVGITSVARVFFEQISERRYVLSVLDAKVPPLEAAGVLPERCRALGTPALAIPAYRVLSFECAGPLNFDDRIVLPWPLAGVVVIARWRDGQHVTAFFRGTGRVVPVELSDLRAGAGSLGRLARRYLLLGSEHILFGIDHLLFILGLLVLARGVLPLVQTITAFTVAHSLTLGAAALGYVPVARAPVEAAIALSIALLAREIVVAHRGGGRGSLLKRRPWIVAFSFGLLHGFGFAGALGEIGLPPSEIAPALLFFNVGVELGQLAFVAVLLFLYALLRPSRRLPSLWPRAERALGYALGAVAMLWFFDRLPAVWGA